MTTHWRNFIRPLVWRCKWTELRIKELQSQASKYDRCIAAHDRKKCMSIDQGTVEQSGSRSLPFRSQDCRKRPMKRRKRKRVEDTTDIASYLSNHVLFSGHGMTSFFIPLDCVAEDNKKDFFMCIYSIIPCTIWHVCCLYFSVMVVVEKLPIDVTYCRK